MDGLLLQDLITIRGAASAHVVQLARDWLDIGESEDVVFYTHVREVIGSAKLTLETSSVADGSSFLPLVPTFSLAVGLRTDVVLASMAKVPPMRFVRWNLTGDGSPWDATLRIWVAAHG